MLNGTEAQDAYETWLANSVDAHYSDEDDEDISETEDYYDELYDELYPISSRCKDKFFQVIGDMRKAILKGQKYIAGTIRYPERHECDYLLWNIEQDLVALENLIAKHPSEKDDDLLENDGEKR